MIKELSSLSFVLALCVPAPIAMAQEVETLQGAIEGLGMRPCSELVAAKEGSPENYRNFALWLSGFMSAANGYQADTFDLTPWQPLEMSIAQVHQYCGANPEKAFAQAAVAYLTFLRSARIQSPEKLMSVRNGESAVFIYPQVLEQAKHRLQAGGLLPADHSGDFDAAFGEALGIYQESIGLKQTGLPDTPTLIKLFR